MKKLNNIHLIVLLNSDGTMIAYNPDKSINITFSDLNGWYKLLEVIETMNLTSEERRGIPVNMNIKNVLFYFVNTDTSEKVSVPASHAKKLAERLLCNE